MKIKFTVDLYNRQLYPGKKTLARRLAEKSRCKYTQAQVEDQLRIMGVSTSGQHESGAPDTLIGQAPTDAGSRWISGGTTADGKPILTQVTAQADHQFQSYILANANSAASNEVPSIYQYDRSPNNGWGFSVTGPFTKFDQSDLNFARNTTADTASMISTNAGRLGAAMAAAAAIPSPYSPGLTAASFTATVAGWLAGGVEQVARPNPRGYISDSLVDTGNFFVSDRLPMLAPALNETAEKVKSSDWMQQIKN